MKIPCFILIGMVLFLVSCTQNKEKAEPPPSESFSTAQGGTPSDFLQGETLYRNHCSPCHGEKAAGTHKGPSFLSSIYHPNHHGDEAFILAARNGVRAHHWQFGDMPPVPNVKEEEVRQIVAYIRWLQRENRIY